MAQQYEIIITTKGEVKVEAIGFSGPSCQDNSEQLEALIGTVVDRDYKPEYHQQAQTVQQQVHQ